MADEERELLLRIRAEGLRELEQVKQLLMMQLQVQRQLVAQQGRLNRSTRSVANATDQHTRSAQKNAKATLHQGQGLSALMKKQSRLGQFFAGNTRGARLFSDAMGLLAGNILRLGVTMGAFVIAGRAVAEVHRKIGEAMHRPIQASAEIETAHLRLIALYQSETRATEELAKATRFAFTTPFEMTDVIAAKGVLKAFRLDTEQNLRRVADMAATMEMSMRDAAVALGKLRLGQFERLERFGISRPLIAERMQVELNQIRQNTPKTLALIWKEGTDMIDEITKGMTERTGKSFEGLASNIKDAWFQVNMAIGATGAFDQRKAAMERELEIINTIRDRIEDMNKGVAGPGFVAGLYRITYETGNIKEEMQEADARTMGLLATTVDLIAALGFFGETAKKVVRQVYLNAIIEARIETEKLQKAVQDFGGTPFVWTPPTFAGEAVDLFKELRAAAEKQQEKLEERLRWLQGEGRLYDAQAKATQMRIAQENKLNQQLARRLELIREFGSVQRGVFMTMERGEAPGAIRERTPLQPEVAEGLVYQETFPAEQAEQAARGAEAINALAEAMEDLQRQYPRLSDEAAAWAAEHEMHATGVFMALENTTGMMSDVWELYFTKSLKAGEEWKMAMDALYRGLGASFMEVLAMMAEKQAAVWALQAMTNFWNPMGPVYLAGAAGMVALAGVLRGAGQAMESGADVNKFQGYEDPEEAKKKERGVQKRGLISMRGAAPITYNITVNTYFNAPVMAMNPQEFGDKVLRPVIEDTLYRAGAA